MEVILLERISRLGAIGDVVKVKNGFGRNYLIPQGKALRANDENRKVFEARRDALESQNAERKAAAEKEAVKFKDCVITVVRQASDDGRLYGSVSVRDVAEGLDAMDLSVDRRLIDLNSAIKAIGVYPAVINLHPEVQVDVKIHVARNADSPMPSELLDEAPEPVMVAEEASDNAEDTSDEDAA